MHIVIHTQYYPPEIGAPQNRLSELAQYLAFNSHQVTILTGMPNYPQGKIYPGYGGLFKTEKKSNTRIVRTLIWPTQKAGIIPRLFNYFSFVFSSVFIGGWFIKDVDYIFTESPPLFLGIAGYILSKWKRAKWIFNVADLWPESAVRLDIIGKGFPLQISEFLEEFCYKKAWVISGQSKSILSNIRERFPEFKLYHLSNGVETERFNPNLFINNFRDKSVEDQGLIVLYAGLHGLAQGLEQILMAAHSLKDISRLQFVFIGDGPQKETLISQAETMGLNNVIFLDQIEKELMPAKIASADICLIPLKMYIVGAVPSKLYEAMASAKPVVLIAEGEAAEIVNNSGAGFVVKPGDIDALVKALQSLAKSSEMRQKMGEMGRKAVEEKFDREKIAEKFERYLLNG